MDPAVVCAHQTVKAHCLHPTHQQRVSWSKNNDDDLIATLFGACQPTGMT